MEVPGTEVMKKKSAGLSKFVEPEAPQTETSERKRGKRAVVGITIRMNQTEWRTVHDAALSEGVSMSELFMRALSDRLKAKGLPPLR
jgi:hypothetical protein